MFGGRGYGGGFFERGCDGLIRGYGAFGMFGLIILILVAVLVIYLIMKNKKTNPDDEILEILKRRYVEGEITEEEYIQKRNVLTNKKHL